MSAPDLETIYDFEGAVEPAAKAVLQSYGLKAFTQMETTELPKERVDVQLLVGAPTGHKGIVSQEPFRMADDTWAAQLVFNIWTERFPLDGAGQPVAADPRHHGRMRARVRMACEVFIDRFTEAVMPFHVLKTIKQQDTDPTVNLEDDLDVSALIFTCLLAVRTGAWPAI